MTFPMKVSYLFRTYDCSFENTSDWAKVNDLLRKYDLFVQKYDLFEEN